MTSINSPPIRTLKSSVGVDSVFLQFKGINKYDVDSFCKELGLSYRRGNEQGKYTRKWTIFLAGGQPISVVYHFSSKTTTFQIGKLMNYSRNTCEQHRFLQDLMQHFQGGEISGLHIAADANIPLDVLRIECKRNSTSIETVDTTIYHNRSNGNVLCIYDKAAQMHIYSTPLSRFELRFTGQLGSWKVKDMMENKGSLEKLSRKIEQDFDQEFMITAIDGKLCLKIDLSNIVEILEDFVAFLQGDTMPVFKDHFKIVQAIASRDKFLHWMSKHSIENANDINPFIKGHRSEYLEEIGIDHKTFNKAVQFYKGIPNFKVSL